MAITFFGSFASIGDGNVIDGLIKVYQNSPEKFNVIGGKDSVMPFEVLFTGLIINQIYFWCMNQMIVQRALGAKNLEGSSKRITFHGTSKIISSFNNYITWSNWILLLWGFFYDNQDMIYPELIKKVLPKASLEFLLL